MKVFFDASISNDKVIFSILKKKLKKLEVGLTYDWLSGNTWRDLDLTDSERVTIYNKRMKCLFEADFSIFDVTVSSMRVGHELTVSMEKMKPTLVLMNENMNDSQNLFLRGSNSKFLTFKNYKNEKDFCKKVEDFIKKSKEEKKVRLDVKIDKRLNEFLDELSTNNNTSKIEEIKRVLLGE